MTLTPASRSLDAVLRDALAQPGGLRVLAGTYAAAQPADNRYLNVVLGGVTVTVPNLNGTGPGAAGQVCYVLADDSHMWLLGAPLAAPGRAGLALVSALPASPVDGQEVAYLASSTQGVVWYLRYRAASASPYKWELVGGSALAAFVAAATAVSSATPGALGVTLTLPLAGDYDVRYGAAITMSAVGAGSYMFTLLYRNAAQIDAAQHNLAAANLIEWPSVDHRFTAFTAGDVLALFGASAGAASTASFASKQLRAIPVRVG